MGMLFKKSDWLYYRYYAITLVPLVASLMIALGVVSWFEVKGFGMLLLALLILSGAAGTIWLSAKVLRHMMRPPLLLARAMRRLTNGQDQVRVKEISSSEMGELERGFNVMSTHISQINEELQREVNRATAELNETLEELQIRNAELDIARRRAIDANQLKSDFLANMSHEIRTPMNGIIGFSDLLSQTNLQTHQLEYVETIRRSAKSLLNIIEDIIEYATLESGELVLQHYPFNLREAIDSAVQLNAPAAHDKRLELVSLVYDDVPDKLVGDEARIVLLLSNLLSNAVKFTASGEVVLRVMLEQEPSNQQVTLGFAVSDTGIGIPVPDQDKLLEAFQQSDLSTKRVYGGAGLGLALCQTLAQAMGGDISFSSVPDEGSNFHVSVKLDLSPEDDQLVAPGSTGKTALLVEAHGLSRIVLRNALNAIGITVEEHETIQEVSDIDVSSCDFAILGTSSFNESLARSHRLLQEFTALGLPCMVMVSSSDPKVLQSFRDSGARYCLSKPSHRYAFEDTVRAILNTLGQTGTQTRLATSSAMLPDKLDTQKPLARMHCLAADDNPINLQLVSHYIENMGGTVIPAENGQQAVDACKAGDVDIAFLDVHMPVMNGFDAARAIRALDLAAPIPLIALTADVAEQNIRAIERSPFDVWLAKPVTEQRLRDSVANIYAQQRPLNHSPQKKAEEPGKNVPPMRDIDQALRISGGSKTVADKLYAALLQELPFTLKKVHESFSDNSFSQMWQEVHKLQGATAVCAVPALHQALSKLQSAIKLEDNEQIGLMLANVQQEANRLVADFNSP